MDLLDAAEPVDNIGEWSVVLDLALVNDNGPTAQSFYVFHVVARQQHRHLLFGLVVTQECLNFALRDDIQSDCRFVEQKYFGRMEQ